MQSFGSGKKPPPKSGNLHKTALRSHGRASPEEQLGMYKKIQHNTAVWTVREDITPAMLDDLLQKIRSPGPGRDMVKDNIVRSGFLCTAAFGDFSRVFVKRYKCRGPGDSIKYLLVPSKAESEWRALNRFEDMQLPCPRPLAFSENRWFLQLQDSCLVMEALTGALPLNEYVARKPLPGVSEKRALIRALAERVAALHRRRVFYRDLHAGNIMVRERETGSPELFFIDLHRALFPPWLARWMRVRDLAQLCNSLPVSRTDGRCFLDRYCAGKPASGDSVNALQAAIAEKALRLEQRRILSRSKRCVKNSTVFEKSVSLRERYFGRRDFGYGAARAAVSRHCSRRTAGLADTIKAASKSVLTVDPEPAGIGSFCIKGYRFMGFRYMLKGLLRRSRAMKNWIAANGLLVRQIPTPLPLAVVEHRWGPFVLESFYLCRWISEASELNDYIKTMPPGCKQQFIVSLARLIRKLHELGVYHADLKSNNILVMDKGAGQWEFHLIDLDRVSFTKKLTFNQRANNLAQINASVADSMTIKDRLKFYRFYAKGTSLLGERKKYYRKILRISRTKITQPYGITFS